MDFLTSKWDLPHLVLLVYELNGPIRFIRDAEAAHPIEEVGKRLRKMMPFLDAKEAE